MKPRGPWQVLATRPVYRDPWLEVTLDDVLRPDGRSGQHTIVAMKPGVSVLALDDQSQVYLTREFHYAVGRAGLEVVSGGCEPGEDPLATARRELVEELGIEASRWTPLGTIDPFTSIVVSPTALFLAEGLTLGSPRPEATEQIACVALPWEAALAAVIEGEITHGPSCVLILRTHLLLAERRARLS